MPGARSFRNAVQSIPHNAWTDIVATGARYNDEGMWSAAAPSRLTTTAAGLHIVTANLATADNAAGARIFRLLSNGARYEALAGHAPGGGMETNASLATLVNAAVGHWYSCGIYQNSGAALNTGGVAPSATDLALTRLAAGTPGARRESAAAQSIASGPWAVLTYDTTAFDVGLGIPAQNDRLVTPSDGTYVIFAGAYLPSAAGLVAPQDLAIIVDGSFWGMSAPGTSADSFQGWSVTVSLPLAAGAVVQAAILQITGAARLTDTASLRPYLAMARVGP